MRSERGIAVSTSMAFPVLAPLGLCLKLRSSLMVVSCWLPEKYRDTWLSVNGHYCETLKSLKTSPWSEFLYERTECSKKWSAESITHMLFEINVLKKWGEGTMMCIFLSLGPEIPNLQDQVRQTTSPNPLCYLLVIAKAVPGTLLHALIHLGTTLSKRKKKKNKKFFDMKKSSAVTL